MTATPQMMDTPSQNGCGPRTGWSTYTVQAGDTLSSIAQRAGVSTDELAAANCLGNASAINVGQGLWVPGLVAGQSPLAAGSGAGSVSSGGSSNLPPPATLSYMGSASTVNCPIPWFFTFDQGMNDPSAPCPDPVQTMQATGQNFEGGRVIWVSALPVLGNAGATLIVIYNDHTWESYADTWNGSQPASDPGIAPPAERVQPERSIGKLWRENASVRGRLGWAYAPEEGFNGRYQTPSGFSGGGAPYFYLDHGKWGVVTRLYGSGAAGNRWEVAGHY